jgi:hypothetical protein
MPRSLAPFSAPEALGHTRSLVDFTIITSGSRFSVQTGEPTSFSYPQPTFRAIQYAKQIGINLRCGDCRTNARLLAKSGRVPTLIERAPALRAGGYVVDFWGLGYTIAERMGLTTDIERIGYHMNASRTQHHPRSGPLPSSSIFLQGRTGWSLRRLDPVES